MAYLEDIIFLGLETEMSLADLLPNSVQKHDKESMKKPLCKGQICDHQTLVASMVMRQDRNWTMGHYNSVIKSHQA